MKSYDMKRGNKFKRLSARWFFFKQEKTGWGEGENCGQIFEAWGAPPPSLGLCPFYSMQYKTMAEWLWLAKFWVQFG